MKSFARYWLVALAWAGLHGALLAQQAGPEPTTGKVLLLRNGQVMEGDIRKTSAEIFVRNGMSEIGVSANLALRLCANWDDAYVFAQTMIKLDDANERVVLARWCHRHGMADRALEQARRALELKPDLADARQIVTALERAQLEKSTTKPAATPTPQPIATVAAQETITAVDVTSETQIAFVMKVQPILMNTCANCHCTGRGGKFQLERVQNVTQKAAAQKNLARVLTYIDLERPTISPLLVKSVMPHGNASQSPMKDRNSPAFRTLQEWIVQTIARNPHLKEYHATKQPQKEAPPRLSSGTKTTASSSSSADAPKDGEVVSRPLQAVPAVATQPTFTAPVASAPLDDPYGPEIFNQHYHAKR
jgi:hypothetical protein